METILAIISTRTDSKFTERRKVNLQISGKSGDKPIAFEREKTGNYANSLPPKRRKGKREDNQPKRADSIWRLSGANFTISLKTVYGD